jgi:hypothetical protein
MNGKSSNEEKITTLNLNGKKGVTIQKAKYDIIKATIVSIIKEKGTITLNELYESTEKAIGTTFEGKIGWYVMAVKLDLEARGTLYKVPNQSPQQLRLVK